MITSEELTAIKRTYGPLYVQKITDQLREGGFLNRKGKPYSEYSVRKVVNGRAHSVLVWAIRNLWKEELGRQEKKMETLIRRSKHVTEFINH